MAKQLSFSEEIPYANELSGITIPVILSYAAKVHRTQAKVDTGGEVCLFSREDASLLKIQVEEGSPITLSSLGGNLEAFGHEVTLQTGSLIFSSTVYFAKHPGLPRNILGRRGWLRNVKLAVVDYDNLLYLSSYDTQ